MYTVNNNICGQPIKNLMKIDGTTLFFLSPQLVAGPQKPQILTASKPKYENFGPKIQMPH